MTPRRWWGILCAAAAVFCFAMAGAYCTTACTPAERAPIEQKLSAALTDEQLACMLATHVPGSGDVHSVIMTPCAIAGPALGSAEGLLAAADSVHLGAPKDAGGP